MLRHPAAKAGFAADITVLVLPCGRSAHLELGWATGQGQRTIVLLDDPMTEPELMYLMNTELVTTLDELLVAVAAENAPWEGSKSEQRSRFDAELSGLETIDVECILRAALTYHGTDTYSDPRCLLGAYVSELLDSAAPAPPPEKLVLVRRALRQLDSRRQSSEPAVAIPEDRS